MRARMRATGRCFALVGIAPRDDDDGAQHTHTQPARRGRHRRRLSYLACVSENGAVFARGTAVIFAHNENDV